MRHLQIFEEFSTGRNDKSLVRRLNKALGHYVWLMACIEHAQKDLKLAELGKQVTSDGELRDIGEWIAQRQIASSKTEILRREKKIPNAKKEIQKLLRGSQTFEKELERYMKEKKIGNALETDPHSIELRKKIEKFLHDNRGKIAQKNFGF